MEKSIGVIALRPQNSDLFGLDRVVDAIGSEEFGPRLAELLIDNCGADICSAFRIDKSGGATVIASTARTRPEMAHDHARRYVAGMHWRHDPALAAILADPAARSSMLVQVDPTKIDDIVLKRDFYRPAGIGDKLAINARRDGCLYIISLLRTLPGGGYSDAAVERVAALSDTIISLVARHATLKYSCATENSLASVELIEARLLDVEKTPVPWHLTNRERQVCARILYGMVALGIALDLGIGECSIDTYRKRAYHRLGIATRHELLRMYLALDRVPASIH